MLRILTAFTMVFGLAVSGFGKVSEGNIGEAKNKAFNALKKVDETLESKKFKNFISTEREKISGISPEKKISISEPKNLTVLGSEYQKTIKNISSMSFDKGLSESKAPIILVSFSVPDIILKNLILEAKKVGSPVAVRGLYRNSLKATYEKVAKLLGQSEAGLIIDPTLFTRFKIKSVPAFILPLEPVNPCLRDKCEIPRHVRARGAVSLLYFLELIERSGTRDQAEVAGIWLKKLRI